MTHVLRYAARTDRGLLRANNQDSVFAGDRLLVIADGMGGHAAGDVASRLVVAAFVELDELPLGSDMVRPLTEATRAGNEAIAGMVDENPELDGMGTTLTALLFDGPVVALAHVGDSRAYLYRNGVLHQISHDDTFVQSLVDDGRITAEEAAHHPQRSLLLRALNGAETDPSVTLRETSPGDRFLICSDGLSDVVSPEAIADALAGAGPDNIADTLIQLALVGGGPDNVTVIVADVLETGDRGGFGVSAGIDPEATGPMQPIHLTQKMPRVPLPPIPEEPAAKAEHALLVGGPSASAPARRRLGLGRGAGSPDDYFGDDGSEADGFGADLGGEDYPDNRDGGDENGLDNNGRESLRPRRYRNAPGRRYGLAGRSTGVEPGTDRTTATGRARTMLAGTAGRWRRRWAFVLAVAVLASVVVTGTVLWAGTRYYIGNNDDQVTVYRGLNQSLLGWKFARVQENSCAAMSSPCRPLKVDDLVQAARDQVTAGITVSTLSDARAVISRLTKAQLPPCPPPGSPTTVAVPGGGALPAAGDSGAATAGSIATSGPSTSGAAHTAMAPVPVPTAQPPLARTTGAQTTVGQPTAPGTRISSRTATGGAPRTGVSRTTPGTRAKALPLGTAATRSTGPRITPGHTARSSGATRAPAVSPRTPPPRTPTPGTVTRTVTVPPVTPASGHPTAGQRLRALLPSASVAGALPTTSSLPVTAARPGTAPRGGATPAIGAPTTRAVGPVLAPTVTVFTTITGSAAAVMPTATPLVSPPAQPGVTCRAVP